MADEDSDGKARGSREKVAGSAGRGHRQAEGSCGPRGQSETDFKQLEAVALHISDGSTGALTKQLTEAAGEFGLVVGRSEGRSK